MFRTRFGKWNAVLSALLIAVAGLLLPVTTAQAQDAQYVPIINSPGTAANNGFLLLNGAPFQPVLVDGMAYDSKGNLYLADGGQATSTVGNLVAGTVYKVDPSGKVTIYAGQGTYATVATTGSTPAGTGGVCNTATPTAAVASATCGDGGGPGSATASGGMLYQPYQLVFDKSDNLYIADSLTYRIRKVGTDGSLSTAVGSGCLGNATYSALGYTWMPGTGACSGAGAAVHLGTARGLAYWVDPSGIEYLFIAETPSGAATSSFVDIYALTGPNAGQIVRYAGVVGGSAIPTDGSSVAASGVLITPASFTGLNILAIDAAGDIYLNDGPGNKVYKIVPDLTSFSDAASNVGDVPTGQIQLYAGNGTAATAGDGNLAIGPATSLNAPYYIALDAAGNLYISTNGAVRKVDTNGYITTVAGTGFTSGGIVNGSAAVASGANGMKAVQVSPDRSQVLVGMAPAVSGAYRVISMNNGFGEVPVGQPYTQPIPELPAVVAPATGNGAASIAPGINVQATASAGVTVQDYTTDPATDFSIVAMTTNLPSTSAATVRTAVTSLPVSLTQWETLTGQVQFQPMAPGLRTARVVMYDGTNYYYQGVYGVGEGSAMALAPGTISAYAGAAGTVTATLTKPAAVALDGADNLYIADASTGTVSMVPAGGTTATAIASSLDAPMGVAVDATGNVFIAENGTGCIQEVSANTGVTAAVPGTCDVLSGPTGLAVDGAGNLYIADTGNDVVRELGVYSGALTTVASGFSGPTGVAVDASGNLYVADTGNNKVIEFTNGVQAASVNVTAPAALAADAAGNVYVVGNDIVNRISSASSATPRVVTQIGGGGSTVYATATDPVSAMDAALSTPSGIAVDEKGNYYIADSLNSYVAMVTASTSTMAFGTPDPVNTGVTSDEQTITLVNIGNQPLTVSGAVAFTDDGTGTQFAPGPSMTCVDTKLLDPGDSCVIGVTFTPAADGATTGTATITDTDGATLVVNLTGAANTVGTPQDVTISAGDGQSTNPLGSFATRLAVKVTDDQTPASVVSGETVTFTIVDGTATGATFTGGLTTVTATTNSGGIATAPVITAGMSQGSFTVTATDSNAMATPTVTFNATVTGAITPTLVLTPSPLPPLTYGDSLTITATLTLGSGGAVATAAAGSVTMTDSIGNPVGPIQMVDGVGTIPYTPSAGEHNLTVDFASDDINVYTNASSTASVSVAAATLTGAVDGSASPSAVYGAEVPVITGSLTGLVGDDDVQLTFVLPAGALNPPDAGSYTLVPALTGKDVDNYTLNVANPPVLTIAPAETSITLSTNPTSQVAGGSVTLAATVTSLSTGGPAPTGTVTFTDSNTGAVLGTGTLSGGVANVSVTVPATGSINATAVYTPAVNSNGGFNFQANSSSSYPIMAVPADFSVSASVNAATIQQGSTANIPMTLTASPTFTGTVSFSCQGLPPNATCAFTPQTVGYTSGNVTATNGIVISPALNPPTSIQNVLLQISTAGSTPATITSENRMPSGKAGITFAAIFLPGLLFAGVVGRRRLNGVYRTLCLLAVMSIGLGAAGFISGCGGSYTDKNSIITQPGPALVQVIATWQGTSTPSITHVTSVAINVVTK
ncbi:MAG: Ig-like domain repeat protein [Acidobacteriaceae bacterium]|nr:Ig-like domain repeat protein [Acidobacteriaceae bacterium]